MEVSSERNTPPQQYLKAIFLVVMATLLFASHDALSKYLSGLYPVVLVVWARYLVHTLLMASLYLPRSGLHILRTQRPMLQALRAMLLLGTSMLFTSALVFLPLAEATAINFLSPLLILLLSVPVLGERVKGYQWAAVIGGFTGVLIIVRPGGGLFSPYALLPLGSAICFSLYQLLTRKLSATDSPVTCNFITGIVNTLIMSVIVIGYWQQPSLMHAGLMLLLGSCGMLGHQLLSTAYGLAPPGVLAPFGYGQIAFAGVLGWLVFAQVPNALALGGIAIIGLSGVAAIWAAQKNN